MDAQSIKDIIKKEMLELEEKRSTDAWTVQDLKRYVYLSGTLGRITAI